MPAQNGLKIWCDSPKGKLIEVFVSEICSGIWAKEYRDKRKICQNEKLVLKTMVLQDILCFLIPQVTGSSVPSSQTNTALLCNIHCRISEGEKVSMPGHPSQTIPWHLLPSFAYAVCMFVHVAGVGVHRALRHTD